MNAVFRHPGQPQMQVEVILASRSPVKEAPILYTLRLRYPRIIHGEVMTHRVFSRNARSSRAVPIKTMLNEVRNTPFVPWHWGKNQKGMQASEECDALLDFPADFILRADEDAQISREEAWLRARDCALFFAEQYMKAGYHKQLPNRLLEPFSWIDTLITSTDLANFLWLRDHEAAEPHLRDLARLAHRAIDAAEVQELAFDAWHLPYITKEDWQQVCAYAPPSPVDMANIRKISTARCARISYAPFDGDASYERELARYDSLVGSDRVHASPLEHQATPDHKVWREIVSDAANETLWSWANEPLHGNLTGWIQNRKLVPNEAKIGPVPAL